MLEHTEKIKELYAQLGFVEDKIARLRERIGSTPRAEKATAHALTLEMHTYAREQKHIQQLLRHENQILLAKERKRQKQRARDKHTLMVRTVEELFGQGAWTAVLKRMREVRDDA